MYNKWSVGQSVTLASPAKMAEVIQMPFGLRTRVGPGNHVLQRYNDVQTQAATSICILVRCED